MSATNQAFEAARTKDHAALATLLQSGVTADARNGLGFTLLHVAARAGSAECVSLLLDAGAAVDAVGPWGETALLEAAANGDVSVVTRLVDAGADLEWRDGRTQSTPLLEAARFANTRVAKALVQRGARTDAVDANGFNALSLAQLNDHSRTEGALLALGVKEQPELAESIRLTRDEVRRASHG